MKNAFHRGLGRATEPQVLFLLIDVLLLTVIWGITLVVLKVRHSDAEHAAAVSSRELLGTYEAQVLRAMREIDQTLKLVKFLPGRAPSRHTLSDFKDKELLPSDLLFTVSIVDVNRRVVESTRTTELESVADQGAFRKQRDSDVFFVGQIPRSPTGEAKLQFGRILTELKAMGIKIAIDDCGTGYSSLSTLQQFPLDTITIDRSFIRGHAVGRANSNLTDAIRAMSESLSLTVVAQGVETKERADLLREHACDVCQAFYFNKPMSAHEFTVLLQAKHQEARVA